MSDPPETRGRPAGTWYVIRHGFLWPLLASLLLAATPWDLALPLRILLGAFCVVALLKAVFNHRRRLRWNIVGLALTAVMLEAWASLPVKWIDGRVGPFAYEEMTLAELCERIRDDHGMPLGLYDGSTGPTLAFSVPERTSRREVLHKLARETNRRWRVGYCGTGRTLLWGMHPISIDLEQP